MWSRFVLYIWPFFFITCFLYSLLIYLCIYLFIYFVDISWLFIYPSIHSLTCHTAVPLVTSTPLNGKDVQAQSPNLS